MAAVSAHHVPPTASSPASSPASTSAVDAFIRSTEASLLRKSGELLSTPPQTSSHPPHLIQLAAQILHNLQYQHDWTSLAIHTHGSLIRSPSLSSARGRSLLPRPLISGVPPHRLYIHPDEQVELLRAREEREKARQQQKERRKKPGTSRRKRSVGTKDDVPDSETAGAQSADAPNYAKRSDLPEDSDDEADEEEAAKANAEADEEEYEGEQRRDWVLPSHIQEKWSLRKFAEVFDAIDTHPPLTDAATNSAEFEDGEVKAPAIDRLKFDDSSRDTTREHDDQEENTALRPGAGGAGGTKQGGDLGGERNLKRVLLATVNDDSTIVYYILHDGLVKPRQN